MLRYRGLRVIRKGPPVTTAVAGLYGSTLVSARRISRAPRKPTASPQAASRGPCARGAHWVAERQGAAVDVDDVGVDAEYACEVDRDARESLVYLDEIQVIR